MSHANNDLGLRYLGSLRPTGPDTTLSQRLSSYEPGRRERTKSINHGMYKTPGVRYCSDVLIDFVTSRLMLPSAENVTLWYRYCERIEGHSGNFFFPLRSPNVRDVCIPKQIVQRHHPDLSW